MAILNQGPTRLTSFDRLLGAGLPVVTLEYLAVETPNIDADVELSIEEAGLVHGFSIWFETDLVPGVGFSTAPDQTETVYGRLFLPLSEPLQVDEGDRIQVSIKAALEDDSHLWVWRGRVSTPDGKKRAPFAHSSAFFNPESFDVREVFGDGCVPEHSMDGSIVRQILLGIDGRQSVSVLTSRITEDHPDRFDSQEQAADFVRNVLERFGKATLCVED